MGLFEQFPYTNFHELNLMWILEALKEIQTTTEQFVAINSLKYADPIQWNIVQQYEKNTIVIDPLTGTAYISVQPVPSGVALTNTDYWTVVFDLGSFVTRAAKNFTDRWEEDTTLTATFPTAAGEWLVWGDTLYVAQVNITAGDSYVVDSNIKRITVEEVKNDIYSTFNTMIGDLDDLNTSDKSSIVNAINEVIGIIGNLTDLNTQDKSSVISAINELVALIGDLLLLNTTDKSTLVNAINEVNSFAQVYNYPKVKSWFETVGNMVTLGADNTGAVSCDDIFDAALSAYNYIYFPHGTYHFTRQHDIAGKYIIGDNAVFNTDSFGLNDGSWNSAGGFNSTYPQMLFNVTGAFSIISGIRFLTDAGGIVIRANNCVVRECYFDTRATIPGSTGYYGITIRNCENTIIDKCIFSMLDANNRDGIHIESKTYYTTISDCIIISGDDAIAINALEGEGGSIVGVNITNCIIGGFGMRFFGNNQCPIRQVNVSNSILRVTSPSVTSGAVRFSNTLNTLGGTAIGGDLPVSDIKFVNCTFSGDKGGDVSFYSLNTTGNIIMTNCRFNNNFFTDDLTAGGTLNIALANCAEIGAQFNLAADTGNYYINISQCDIPAINKINDCNLTLKCLDCDIAAITISGGGTNTVRLYDCLLALTTAVLTHGRYEIKNCTVSDPAFSIDNGDGVYLVDNLAGKDDSSAFVDPHSATRIAGEVIVSQLPLATGMVNGDSLLLNNGYATEKFYVRGGAWKKYFIGEPQSFSAISAAPTMTDFNNLVTALKATGILY